MSIPFSGLAIHSFHAHYVDIMESWGVITFCGHMHLCLCLWFIIQVSYCIVFILSKLHGNLYTFAGKS